ncbi:MAG: hypothetical protein JKY52_00160 [Flavobacteriales bacterium]|nr:hypothetical protein [Flavobacteriales bacterium]
MKNASVINVVDMGEFKFNSYNIISESDFNKATLQRTSFIDVGTNLGRIALFLVGGKVYKRTGQDGEFQYWLIKEVIYE